MGHRSGGHDPDRHVSGVVVLTAHQGSGGQRRDRRLRRRGSGGHDESPCRTSGEIGQTDSFFFGNSALAVLPDFTPLLRSVVFIRELAFRLRLDLTGVCLSTMRGGN